MTSDGRDAGFTLVEVLVSLALAALVTMLLTQTMLAVGGVSRVTARLGAQGEVRLVRDHLRRTVASLAGRTATSSRPVVIGRPDRIALVVDADGATQSGGRTEIVLFLAPTQDGPGLAETRRPAGSRAPAEPEILLAPVAGLRLRYFGAQGREVQPRWHDGWARVDRPPSLVEIAVPLPAGDRRSWSALVLPVGSGL